MPGPATVAIMRMRIITPIPAVITFSETPVTRRPIQMTTTAGTKKIRLPTAGDTPRKPLSI